NILQGSFCYHRTPELCLGKRTWHSPAKQSPFQHGSVSASVRSVILRSSGAHLSPSHLSGTLARRSMKIRERSKTRSRFIQHEGTPRCGSRPTCGTLLRTLKATVLTETPWSPAWRPQLHPPIPGGTRCRFSIGPI